jgi:hypothetical protein
MMDHSPKFCLEIILHRSKASPSVLPFVVKVIATLYFSFDLVYLPKNRAPYLLSLRESLISLPLHLKILFITHVSHGKTKFINPWCCNPNFKLLRLVWRSYFKLLQTVWKIYFHMFRYEMLSQELGETPLMCSKELTLTPPNT